MESNNINSAISSDKKKNKTNLSKRKQSVCFVSAQDLLLKKKQQFKTNKSVTSQGQDILNKLKEKTVERNVRRDTLKELEPNKIIEKTVINALSSRTRGKSTSSTR